MVTPNAIVIRETGTLSVDDNENISLKNFQLEQNYPNPFNPTTVIRYQLPITSDVTIKVFNILGKEITTLVNEELSTGEHEVTFNATEFPSGIYFYQLRSGNYIETKKMIYLK